MTNLGDTRLPGCNLKILAYVCHAIYVYEHYATECHSTNHMQRNSTASEGDYTRLVAKFTKSFRYDPGGVSRSRIGCCASCGIVVELSLTLDMRVVTHQRDCIDVSGVVDTGRRRYKSCRMVNSGFAHRSSHKQIFFTSYTSNPTSTSRHHQT
jgi:hypothetical protein